MILTCPECGTKYVVKDGAIPDGGRKVRCAACKHSWHQDPEGVADSGTPVATMATVPVPDEPAVTDGNDTVAAVLEQEPVPVTDTISFGAIDQEISETVETDPAFAEPVSVPTQTTETGVDRDWEKVDTGSAWDTPQPAPTVDSETEDFQTFADDDGDDDGTTRRRWPLVLGTILLLAAAAVAFWFLAPSSMKQQVGLARGSSPLKVMNTSNDRQSLESGGDLLTVSGRIINPTRTSQPVPPLRAELLDESKSKVIHSWMISPPVDTLSPNESSTFHSAEMGVPEGGKFLRVRLSTEG